MSSGLMLGDIIMNLFSDITKHTTYSVEKYLFYKIHDDIAYFYKGSLQDYLWKKITADTKKTLRSHNFIEKLKL